MSAVEDLYAQLLERLNAQSYPPVEHWQPPRGGRIDIRIDREGRWYHEGERIERPELVRLFSTILRKDADGYCLVTPAERLLISVDEVPFVVVDVEQGSGEQGAELLFTTNVGDLVVADPEHPVWVEEGESGPRPFVHVRGGLNARINRATYYRLAELCEAEGGAHWLTSRGERFRLG